MEGLRKYVLFGQNYQEKAEGVRFMRGRNFCEHMH